MDRNAANPNLDSEDTENRSYDDSDNINKDEDLSPASPAPKPGRIHPLICRSILPTSPANVRYLSVCKQIRRKKRMYAVRTRRFIRQPRSPAVSRSGSIDQTVVKTEPIEFSEGEDETHDMTEYGDYEINYEAAETSYGERDTAENSDGERQADETNVSEAEEPSPSPPPAPRSPPRERLYPNMSRIEILEAFAAAGRLIVVPDEHKKSVVVVNYDGSVERAVGVTGVRVEPPATPYFKEYQRKLTAQKNKTRREAEAADKENIPGPQRVSVPRPSASQAQAEAPLFVNASDPSHVRQQWYQSVIHSREPEIHEIESHDSMDVDDNDTDPGSVLTLPLSPGNGVIELDEDEDAEAMTLPISPSQLNPDPEPVITMIGDGSGDLLIDLDPPEANELTGDNSFPKPSIPYSCLVTMALMNAPAGTLPVSEIYQFLCDHFPFFRSAPSGWKNSVRHNLSLNKGFVKVTFQAESLLEQMVDKAKRAHRWTLEKENPGKAGKMERELLKWLDRTGRPNLENSMVDPENLDLLLAGEFKRDYSGRVTEDDLMEIDDDDIQVLSPPDIQILSDPGSSVPSSFTGTVSQMRAFLQKQHSSSIALMSVEDSESDTPIIEPIGPGALNLSSVLTQGQYLHQVGPSLYQISPFPDPGNLNADDGSTPLILRRPGKPGMPK